MSFKTFLGYLLLLLVVLTTPSDCYAQFWKRKKHHRTEQAQADTVNDAQPWHQEESHKSKRRLRREAEKEQRRLKKSRSKASNNKKGGKKIKNQIVSFPPTIKKTKYRIDVVAAVYLNEITKVHGPHGVMKIPEKAIAGLGFYQGVRMAIDSLKDAGLPVDIFIHDISVRKENTDSLITKGKLDSADLVIGAVSPVDVPKYAAYCQKRKINFVSAISPADGGVRANKYLTITQPVLRTHCDFLYTYIASHFEGHKLLWLFRNNNTGDLNAYNYFTTYFDDNMPVSKLSCNKLPTVSALRSLVDSVGKQTVLISVLDVVYADSLLRLLNHEFPSARFDVIGMPSWTGLNLQRRSSSYAGMGFYVPVPFEINQDAAATREADKRYKAMCSGSPDEFVYRGYETILWYSHLLITYGTIFNEHYKGIVDAPFTGYDIQPSFDARGQLLYEENKNIYMLHYVSGSPK